MFENHPYSRLKRENGKVVVDASWKESRQCQEKNWRIDHG